MVKPLCILVGCGPGLGLSLVRRFHDGGFKVAALSRDERRCQSLLARVGGSPADLKALGADAGDAAALHDALDRAVAWGSVQPDVVIYNAAAMSEGPASGLGPSLFDDLKVTVGGAVTLAAFAAKAMKQAGKGSILFTGGGLSLEPHPAWAALGMGKAALRNYAFSLHRELREAGVNVCIVTVCGIIKPGSDFDPDKIAEIYWGAHATSPESWREEIVYMPGGNKFYNRAG